MQASTKFFSQFSQFEDSLQDELVNSNALYGLAYAYSELGETVQRSKAKSIYLKQWLQNETHLNFLETNARSLLLLEPEIILLKGASLLQDLYNQNLGARFMSDIDLLIPKNSLITIARYLEKIKVKNEYKI